MGEKGSDVPVSGITPAEALVLVAMFHPNAGTNPLTELRELPDVERTPVQEKRRLIEKYGKKKVDALMPGAVPQLPTSFDEAFSTGLGAELPEEKFVEHNLSV
jgi:hypothetical protein